MVHISREDRFSLLHSLAFGSAFSSLFQATLNGASLHVFDVKSQGVSKLAEWLDREKITVYHSPPAVFRQLAEVAPQEHAFSSLRIIRLTGSAISRRDFDGYAKVFASGALLHLVMNATEVNLICSLLADGSFHFPREGSPAGYPVTDKKIVLIGEDGCEVAPGRIGEIVVTSSYLPPGPRQNLALWTSSGQPRATGPVERQYMTGDLGQMRSDGLVIHRGRKDFMVKIRGYRIEMGEIERALLNHPSVSEAGIVAWERKLDEKYLVGYVVLRRQAALTVRELRMFLSRHLPEYMIPSAFIFMESLPMTNGKLDATALPKPEDKRPVLSTPYVPPRSEIERDLVQVWEEVLDIRPIGIYDNFFDLGGHSLAATRVVSRVIKQFQSAIPLKSLFQSPTVAEMAVVITGYQGRELGVEDLEKLLTELESLSDEKAEQLVSAGHSRDQKN